MLYSWQCTSTVLHTSCCKLITSRILRQSSITDVFLHLQLTVPWHCQHAHLTISVDLVLTSVTCIGSSSLFLVLYHASNISSIGGRGGGRSGGGKGETRATGQGVNVMVNTKGQLYQEILERTILKQAEHEIRQYKDCIPK